MFMTRPRVAHLPVAFSIAVVAAAALLGAQGRSGEAPAIGVSDAAFVPGEVLVQFAANAGEAGKAEARGRVGGRTEEVVVVGQGREGGRGDLELVTLPPGLSVASAMARLKAHPSVEFAEPNWVYHHEATSNDPYYTNGSLWGMYGDATWPANQFGSQAVKRGPPVIPAARASTSAIIDEGFMFTHPDLAANSLDQPIRSSRRHRQRRQRLRGRHARLGFRRQRQRDLRRHPGRPRHARGGHDRRGGRQRRWASRASTGTSR